MMTLKSMYKTTWFVTLTVSAILALAIFVVTGVEAARPGKSITVDVAQNMATFVADEAPLHGDGMPAYGNSFIIQGFIYPEGTLNGSNGIVVTEDEEGNPIVEPEFPDEVIGTWTCRGWFVGDGLHTVDEPWAVTTQLFSFEGEYGEETIVSDGYEIPFGVEAAVHRAITGGTGQFAGARGEQIQELVGINATDAANFRIELNVEKK